MATNTNMYKISTFFYRQGFDTHILRFSARLLIDGKVDTTRKFVIAYFLSDDTILVSLDRELNSGNILQKTFEVIYIYILHIN